MKHKKSITLITLIVLSVVLAGNADAEVILQKSESYITLEDAAYEKIILTYSASYTSGSENGSVYENFNYIKVSGKPSNISVFDSKGELEFITWYENENGDNITKIKFNFRSKLNEGDYYTVTIRFSKELEAPADNLAYETDYEWDSPPLHLNVVSRLSGKYELYNSLNDPVSIFSDNDYLIMRWVGYSTPRFINRLSFGEKEETGPIEPDEPIEPIQNEENNNSQFKYYLLAAVITIIIISIFVLFFVRKKLHKKSDNLAARKVEKTLTPAETAIVEELRIENNLTQVELCKKTGIARSTMSRTIAKLESRGIVEKIEDGMSTRVKLVGWMKK